VKIGSHLIWRHCNISLYYITFCNPLQAQLQVGRIKLQRVAERMRFTLVQGTLLWQPVKYGRCSQTSRGMTFTLCFGIRQQIFRSAFKRFNDNNQATSCSNLVNLRPIISEFMLLKCSIFAAIHPQFDDDLHSSRWCFQTDRKIAILISAE